MDYETAHQIYREYAQGHFTLKELGKKYGITATTISNNFKQYHFSYEKFLHKRGRKLHNLPPRKCKNCGRALSRQQLLWKNKFCSHKCRYTYRWERQYAQKVLNQYILYKRFGWKVKDIAEAYSVSQFGIYRSFKRYKKILEERIR